MSEIVCESNSLTHSTATLVGSLCIFYFLLKILIALRKLFLREDYNTAKRYGACTWVFITGATSPPGYGLALELARRGFNLILVGRDTEGLQKMRDILVLHHNQTVKVRIVYADFREAVNLSFYTDIMKKIEDLDISIVIHAVGAAALSKRFHQLSMEKNQQCLVVNMFAPVLLSHQIIPRMQQRYHRSAIIIVGGENAKQPIPGMSVSSGAKAFIGNFSVAASVEYEEKIDILSVQPFAVKKFDPESEENKRESIFVIDSEKFAKATLGQLGHERASSGHWIHQLLSWLYSLLPEEIALQFWSQTLFANQVIDKNDTKTSSENSVKNIIKRLSKTSQKDK